MKVSQAFPSKYLKAADIPEGRRLPLEIDRVQLETMEQTGEEKPVLYFRGKERGLVLNVTNATTIAEMHGEETDEWAGKELVLFSTMTSFGGRRVGCLRVAAVNGESTENPGAGSSGDANGDDIPF